MFARDLERRVKKRKMKKPEANEKEVKRSKPPNSVEHLPEISEGEEDEEEVMQESEEEKEEEVILESGEEVEAVNETVPKNSRIIAIATKVRSLFLNSETYLLVLSLSGTRLLAGTLTPENPEQDAEIPRCIAALASQGCWYRIQ